MFLFRFAEVYFEDKVEDFVLKNSHYKAPKTYEKGKAQWSVCYSSIILTLNPLMWKIW